MSANMQDLIPEFRTKVNTALAALANEGLLFKPYLHFAGPGRSGEALAAVAVGRRRGQADTRPQGRRLRFHGRLL